jgi:hypothetical protein
MLSMQELEKVDLSHNRFQGPLPRFDGCVKLRILDLSSNCLDSILRRPQDGKGDQRVQFATEAAASALVKGDLQIQYPRLRRIDLCDNMLSGPERAAISRRFEQRIQTEPGDGCR